MQKINILGLIVFTWVNKHSEYLNKFASLTSANRVQSCFLPALRVLNIIENVFSKVGEGQSRLIKLQDVKIQDVQNTIVIPD